jgi:hypothetical protein
MKFKPNDPVIQVSTGKHFTFLSATGTTATVKDAKGNQSTIALSDLKAA